MDKTWQTVTVAVNDTQTLTFFNAPKHVFTVYANWMDEVLYTLPQVPKRADLPKPKEVTVGMDKQQAAVEAAAAKDERREPLYVTYDEDGSYTIKLEDDAFFPYVVDVRYRLSGRNNFMLPVITENGELYHDHSGKAVWQKLSTEQALVPESDENGNIIQDKDGNFNCTSFQLFRTSLQ